MIEDTLNESQKKRIQERLKLDFNVELLKSNTILERTKFSANFRKYLDLFITDLYYDGVLFYGFTIVMPFTNKNDPKMWYYTHLRVEDLINYIKDNIELIEFCYLSIELHDNLTNHKKINKSNSLIEKYNHMEGVPFFKGIIGVRSLLGKNDCHFNQIKRIFNIPLNETVIKKLSTIKIIKNYWNFVIKQNNYKFHRFTQYSDNYNSFYGEMSDLELQYDNLEHVAFGLDENTNSLHSTMCGIKDLNPDTQTIINYLFSIYMTKAGFYLYGNKIYQRNKKNVLKCKYSIEYLRCNNIRILEKLKKLFPQQLKNLQISTLFNQSWNNFFNALKINNHYLPTIKLKKKKKKKQKLFYKFNSL